MEFLNRPDSAGVVYRLGHTKLESVMVEIVPAGWKDDGTTLTAPNGVVVVKGFREWVLAHGWNAEDEPQGPEVYADQVQMADPAQGSGSIQAFLLTGQLCWTQAHGVYVAHPGAEIFALRAALDAAQKSAPTAAEMAALAAIRSVGEALKAAEAPVTQSRAAADV